MADSDEIRVEGREHRKVAAIVIGILAVLGGLYVIFLLFFAASEPERMADPTGLFDEATPREGVAVPDGGPLTNVPTQAAPNSPARDAFEAQQQDNAAQPSP